jgi:hypothetical protein
MKLAKEKAKELVDKFKYNTRVWNETNGWQDCSYNAKQCALIAVDEIIQLDYNSLEYYGNLSSTEYYKEVKHEIENL